MDNETFIELAIELPITMRSGVQRVFRTERDRVCTCIVTANNNSRFPNGQQPGENEIVTRTTNQETYKIASFLARERETAGGLNREGFYHFSVFRLDVVTDDWRLTIREIAKFVILQ